MYRRSRTNAETLEIADQLQQLATSVGLPNHQAFAWWVDWGRETWAQTTQDDGSSSTVSARTLRASTLRTLYQGQVPTLSETRERLHRRAVYTLIQYEESLLVPVPLAEDGTTAFTWNHFLALHEFFRHKQHPGKTVAAPFDKRYRRISHQAFANFGGMARATFTQRSNNSTDSLDNDDILSISFAHQRRVAFLEWARTTIWAWVLEEEEQEEWPGRLKSWETPQRRECAALAYVSNMLTPLLLILDGGGSDAMKKKKVRVLSENAWNGPIGETTLENLAEAILKFANDNDWALQNDIATNDIPPGATIEDIRKWRSFVQNSSIPIAYQRDAVFNAIIDIMQSVVLPHASGEIHIPPLANHERVLEYMDTYEEDRWSGHSCESTCTPDP